MPAFLGQKYHIPAYYCLLVHTTRFPEQSHVGSDLISDEFVRLVVAGIFRLYAPGSSTMCEGDQILPLDVHAHAHVNLSNIHRTCKVLPIPSTVFFSPKLSPSPHRR